MTDDVHNHLHGSKHLHGADQAGNEARLRLAAVLTGAFMVAEAVGGIIAGSLALLADAGHMLTDAAGLVLAWLAFRVARRPSDVQRTYGFHRLQVLAAYSNGLTLFFIALAICYEAVRRLQEPAHHILAEPMLVIAVLGLLVNILIFLVLQGAERDNLNIRGAVLHVMGDLLGSAAAIVAALVILWTGWTPIDPILSMLVVLLILRGAWQLVRDSGHILLEGTPKGLDLVALKSDLAAAIPGIADVHHVHAWSLTDDKRMATLHVRVAEAADAARLAAAVKARLHELYGIDHATVEIECEHCADHAGALQKG